MDTPPFGVPPSERVPTGRPTPARPAPLRCDWSRRAAPQRRVRRVPVLAALVVVAVIAAATAGAGGRTAAWAAPLAPSQTFTNPGLGAGNPRFVDAAVRDLLGRPSTAADQARWAPGLDAGQSRAAFASTVARTPEWASVVVTDLYGQVFGRAPDAGGLSYWSIQLAGGTPTAVLAGLLFGSPEYFVGAGSTSAGYVDALYLNLLRRLPDPGGRAYWIGLLDAGSDRATLARQLFLSVEANGRRVDGLYQRLLGRPPDVSGRAYWANVLTTHDDLLLAALLVGSPEYFTAAQTRFTSASVTTATGTVVLSGPQVVDLQVDGAGTGAVTSAAGAALPAVGSHVVVSRGTTTGFAVGLVLTVTTGVDGTTRSTFRSAGLAEAFTRADIVSTTELPRNGASAVVAPPVPGGWTCTAGAGSLDVATRFTADTGFDGRLQFDTAAGTYTARAISTVSTGFTANLEAAATTAGCHWSGGLWNARWAVLVEAGPIAIPLVTRLDGMLDLDAGFAERFSSSAAAAVTCRIGFTASVSVPLARQAGCDAPTASAGGSVAAPGRAETHAEVTVDVQLGSVHTGLALRGTLDEAVTTATDAAVRPWWWTDLTVDAGARADLRLGRWASTMTWPGANVLRTRLASASVGDVPPGPAPVSVASATLAPGVAGRAYASTLVAAGGVSPYRWAAASLPAGLTLSGDRLTGTPTGVGITAVTVTVTDAIDRSASKRLDVVVDPAAARSLTVTRVTSGFGEHGRSFDQALSRDGTSVAFSSDADNISIGDTNRQTDVFTWDRTRNVVGRITSGQDPSTSPSISGDGRFIAYWSGPAIPPPGAVNGAGNVFLWDRTTGTTRQVTAGNGWSGQPSISADGRHVTFSSRATDLVTGDTNGTGDVFVWDRTTGVTVRITNGDGPSLTPAISTTGRFVVYRSTATDLVDGGPVDPAGTADVFVWDRSSGTSRVTSGVTALDPGISDDGRFVAFSSESDALVPGDGNDVSDVFVADRSGPTIRRVTAGSGPSEYPSISGDGRIVAFSSSATELVAGDTNGFADIFVWTQSTRTVSRVVQGNGRSIAPRASGDGQRLALLSAATSLAWHDFNGHSDDVFLVG